MKGLRFLDFDLMFQRTADGYRAQVLDSPAGQAAVEFALPFQEFEIENFLLRFGRPRQPVRRLATSQIGEARAFGGRLFEAAFSGEVRSCLSSSLDEARRLDVGLRIRLRLNEAPELNDLPWEFLLYSARDYFLALSAETPLVRYLDLPERIRPLAVKPPLEVLAVISSTTDFAQLDVEAEWRKLQESLAELQERGLLLLRRLESPTLPHLQRWLRRETCHILHFVGHGGFNSRTDDGLLVFTDDNGRGRVVTGQTLGTLLHDHRPLRLAVLNACEGARTSRTDPFAGVAQSLVQQGIPAVVAMQFEITDKAAITFAYEFYTAVVDGYPIDAALAEARKALFSAGHELEWGTPVLYMRSPDGRIFDIEPAVLAAIKVEPTAAKPVPIEARPAPVEVQPAPVVPKAPPREPASGLLRRWRWSVALLLLASLGLAGIWWTLHQPSRLYERGLQASAVLEVPTAREYFEEAVRRDDDLPLVRSALAEAFMKLGLDGRSREEAKRAFDERKKLSPSDQLLIEARYRRIYEEWGEAIRLYQQLHKEHPGEVDYAVGLAEGQIVQGNNLEALRTIQRMQKISSDPRLDLTEATAAFYLGDFTRQMEAASRAVEKAEKSGLVFLAAEGLLLRGVAHYRRGVPEKAIADIQAAEERARENPEQVARAQNSMAGFLFHQGKLTEAGKWYRSARDNYHLLGDKDSEAEQRRNLVAIYAEQGKLRQAREEYEEIIEIYDSTASRSERAVALANLGWILAQQGDLEGATKLLDEAIGIFESTGEREQAAAYQCTLSKVYLDSLELELAQRSLATCLQVALGAGDPSLEANALTNQGDLLLFQGDLKSARDAHQRAREIYEEIEDQKGGTWSRLSLAEIQLERNLAAETTSLIEPAVKYFRLQRMLDEKALAEVVLARAYLAQGALHRARSLIDEAKERAADSEFLEVQVRVALVEARYLATMKDVAEARQVLQRVLDDSRARRHPKLKMEARLAQAELETLHGNHARGRELLSQVEEDAKVRRFRLVETKAAQLLRRDALPKP
jgi:tetratricopeptide (TPR) repeat protein